MIHFATLPLIIRQQVMLYSYLMQPLSGLWTSLRIPRVVRSRGQLRMLIFLSSLFGKLELEDERPRSSLQARRARRLQCDRPTLEFESCEIVPLYVPNCFDAETS